MLMRLFNSVMHFPCKDLMSQPLSLIC